MKRVPWSLLALPALALARLAPAHGIGLGLRLAAATLVVLVPGALVGRALRLRGPAATVGWTCGALFVSWSVVFAVHASLRLCLVALGVIAAVALLVSLRREQPELEHARAGAVVLVAGVAFGIALWHVAGQVDGDALFHLARVRKLDAFGSLGLRTVDEFRDGGLHPGYAFPLWHGLLAVVARLAGVDPAAVVLHESTVLAPLAFLLAFEAGAVLFGSGWLGIAVTAATVAQLGLAGGHGGSFVPLDLPASAARLVLVPAALALFFRAVAEPSAAALATLAAASVGLALVHPTYALFLALPLGGFAVVRAALAWRDAAPGGGALVAYCVPFAAVFVWLLPLVRETASHDPSAAAQRASLARYGTQLHVSSLHSFSLAPEVFARTGAVAVAALVCVPLAGLASRRRWAAFVLGGSLVLLALLLVPALFTRFSDAVSLSQARRAAGFLPFAFALAGGAAVVARAAWWAAPAVGLAAGIALDRAYPGSFGLELAGGGGPAVATWIAAVVGAAALVLALVLRRLDVERRGAAAGLAVCLLCLPVAVRGFERWTPRDTEGADPLSPGLLAALRAHVPRGAVVYAEPQTSYRIAAYAPVYIAVAPLTHVADTQANHPARRLAAYARFRGTHDLSIPRRAGATWIVADYERSRIRLTLPAAYRDPRYTLYRLPRAGP